jgi:lysozyme
MRRVLCGLLAMGLLASCSDNTSSERVGETNEAYTTQCGTVLVDGIDVYDGQGTINWSDVKAHGKGFAIIKASQGDYNSQKMFMASWSGAKAAGVIRGPYHFFDGTIDGKTQAMHFLSILDAAGGLEATDLPPTLDLECPTSAVEAQASANCEYTGNSGWVDVPTLKQRVYDWLDTVEQATGRKPIIYSYPSWFAGATFTDAKLAEYPLWIATYGMCASVPMPWTSSVIWQYSGTGTDAGVAGQVDEDHFFGDVAALTGWIAKTNEIDAGTDGGAVPPQDAQVFNDASGDGGGPLLEDVPASDSSGCSFAANRRGVGSFASIVIGAMVACFVRRRRGYSETSR